MKSIGPYVVFLIVIYISKFLGIYTEFTPFIALIGAINILIFNNPHA